MRRVQGARYVPAILILLGFLFTLERAPIAWTDEIIYASTAWGLHLNGSGVPSIVQGLPGATDHEAFYGPVFFNLARTSFDLFGLSMWSFRLVCLIGALLVATASAAIVRAFGGSAGRQVFAFTVLLLTPELGAAATNGRMDALATGLALMAIAVLLPTFIDSRNDWWRGPASGAFLALSALTTPRAFLMVIAILLSSAAIWWMPAVRRRLSFIAVGQSTFVFSLLMLLWAVASQGNPIRWLRFLIAAGMGTPVDVTIAPNAARWWTLTPWSVITLTFAATAAVYALVMLCRSHRTMSRTHAVAAAFVLAAATLNVAMWLMLSNLTFVFGTYFALPLLSVALALPDALLPKHRSVRRVAVGLLLLCCVGVRGLKYAALAATWDARDPAPLEQFMRAHVPVGSEVIGVQSFGFYAVERAGSRYRLESSGGQASWAQTVENSRTQPLARVDDGHVQGRFLLKSLDDPGDTDYACALADPASLVATYVPAANRLDRLGSIGPLTGAPGYPRTALYRLPSDCHP